MKNKRNSIILATIIVLAGATTYVFYQKSTSTPMGGTDRSQAAPTEDISNGESATYKKYAALKGEDYDKAFIANMIVHHDGAINMASVADAASSRQEIKDLSMNIMSSQAKEMSDMTAWQEQWGYPTTNAHMMVDGGGSAGESMDNAMMTSNELEGLTGDAFDKKFLELMIAHHEDAIEMSRPAATNASHQEVKDLARAIIAAQSKEITEMKLWQEQWGYDTSMKMMDHSGSQY